jgi:hypothetical protein
VPGRDPAVRNEQFLNLPVDLQEFFDTALVVKAVLSNIHLHMPEPILKQIWRYLSSHFECDRIPYALETDWLAGAAGLEPLHHQIC